MGLKLVKCEVGFRCAGSLADVASGSSCWKRFDWTNFMEVVLLKIKKHWFVSTATLYVVFLSAILFLRDLK